VADAVAGRGSCHRQLARLNVLAKQPLADAEVRGGQFGGQQPAKPRGLRISLSL
jgi:hypothetical protein